MCGTRELNGADSAQGLADAIALTDELSRRGRVGSKRVEPWPGPFCSRCGHEPHDDRDDPRCPEIVAANWSPDGPDPDYCGCVDVDALYVRMRRAETAIVPRCIACSEPALRDSPYCVGHDRIGEYRVTDETHWAANE